MTDIKIDSTDKRPDLPEYDDSVFCHKCDSIEHIETGFGLAGGGFGPYTFCNHCGCVVTKSCEPCE